MMKQSKAFPQYRIIRNHRSIFKRPLTQQNIITPIQSNLVYKIGFSSQYTLHLNNNNLILHDDFTYAQTSFSSIKNDSELDFNDLIYESYNKHELTVYLSQSFETTFSFENKEYLQDVFVKGSHQGVRLEFLENIANNMFKEKQDNETLILSIIGFEGTSVFDFLDFDKVRQKIKLSNNSNIKTNLVKMIIKDFDSFIQVIGISRYLQTNQTQAIVYKIQRVKMASSPQNLQKYQIIKNITVIKLFPHATLYFNQLGTVLQELNNKGQNPITARQSKLTSLIKQQLNIKTKIRIFIEIQPQRQPMKTILSLINFNNYLGRKVALRKNYIRNDIDIRKLRKNKSTKINSFVGLKTQYYSKFQSLMTQTLSSLSKKRKYLKSLEKQQENQFQFKQHNLKKVYNIQ